MMTARTAVPYARFMDSPPCVASRCYSAHPYGIVAVLPVCYLASAVARNTAGECFIDPGFDIAPDLAVKGLVVRSAWDDTQLLRRLQRGEYSPGVVGRCLGVGLSVDQENGRGDGPRCVYWADRVHIETALLLREIKRIGDHTVSEEEWRTVGYHTSQV